MLKTCVICEAPSGIYPLCTKCFRLRDEGKIKQCDCKTWHYIDSPCKCAKDKPSEKIIAFKGIKATYYLGDRVKHKSNGIGTILNLVDGRVNVQFDKGHTVNYAPTSLLYMELLNNGVEEPKEVEPPKNLTVTPNTALKNIKRCLTCDAEANEEHLFCKKCYAKYNNKTLLIKITKCQEIELLDNSYEGKFTCEDGHIVKSRAERDIDNFLFKQNIPHAYEKAVYFEEEDIHVYPDFFLSDRDIYLEHWGLAGDENYEKKMKFKLDRYKKMGCTVICTYEKDLQDPEVSLKKKLNQKNYKVGEISFLEKMGN